MPITRTSFKKGHSVTTETRDKISIGLVGNNNGCGHQVTEEHKEILRNSRLGTKQSLETKKKLSLFFKGKKVSEKHKRAIRDGHVRGNKNPSYKHGLSKTKEYLTLKTKVRKYRLMVAGELTIKTIQMVYEDNVKQYGTLTCYLCLNPIEFGKDSLEHKIPICRGGTNAFSNLAVAHTLCNSIKGKKTDIEFFNHQGVSQ